MFAECFFFIFCLAVRNAEGDNPLSMELYNGTSKYNMLLHGFEMYIELKNMTSGGLATKQLKAAGLHMHAYYLYVTHNQIPWICVENLTLHWLVKYKGHDHRKIKI